MANWVDQASPHTQGIPFRDRKQDYGTKQPLGDVLWVIKNKVVFKFYLVTTFSLSCSWLFLIFILMSSFPLYFFPGRADGKKRLVLGSDLVVVSNCVVGRVIPPSKRALSIVQLLGTEVCWIRHGQVPQHHSGLFSNLQVPSFLLPLCASCEVTITRGIFVYVTKALWEMRKL